MEQRCGSTLQMEAELANTAQRLSVINYRNSDQIREIERRGEGEREREQEREREREIFCSREGKHQPEPLRPRG